MHTEERNSYTEQINQVQDYIENHLDEPLTVKQLSFIAGFSEYHFQRIFKLVTGEGLYGFIKRLRLEKAAYMLLADKRRPIIDIAMSVGFLGQPSFAKAFKAKYGVSGSAYRRTHDRKKDPSRFVSGSVRETDMSIEPLAVKVRREQARRLLYVRYAGPYKGDSTLFLHLFQRLYEWADERGLITADTRWFVIYHDFGDETEEEQLRLSVCMSVDGEPPVGGDVGVLTLAEGLYAAGSFMVNSDEYGKAWYYMYTKWLPDSGYKPADTCAYEYYPPADMQGDRRLVEICIPLA